MNRIAALKRNPITSKPAQPAPKAETVLPELNARDASKLLAMLEHVEMEHRGEGFDVKPIGIEPVRHLLGQDWKIKLDSSPGAFLAEVAPDSPAHVLYLDPAALEKIEKQPIKSWEAAKLVDNPDKHVGHNPLQVVHQGNKVLGLQNFTASYLEKALGVKWKDRLEASKVYFELATDAPVSGEIYEVNVNTLSGLAQEYRLQQSYLERVKAAAAVADNGNGNGSGHRNGTAPKRG